MKTYTITLSDAQDKALSVVSYSQQDWIENVVAERCRIAIEEIVAAEVERITAAGGTISGTKEDIVNAAEVETAAERTARLEAERQSNNS
jgi:aspartyl aminopeptidase